MTPAQLLILSQDISTKPEFFSLPNNSDAGTTIADWYNTTATPAFIVWRTSVAPVEIMSNGFRWSDIDVMTAGKYRIWQLMAGLEAINPSKANVRQGLNDAFTAGTPMMLAIAPHLRRSATRVEKLFATGTGTDASPATMVLEDALTYADVITARNL